MLQLKFQDPNTKLEGEGKSKRLDVDSDFCRWLEDIRRTAEIAGLYIRGPDERKPHVEVLKKGDSGDLLVRRANEIHGGLVNIEESIGRFGPKALVCYTGNVRGYGMTHATIAYFHGGISDHLLQQLRQICLESAGKFTSGTNSVFAATGGIELRDFQHPREWITSHGSRPSSGVFSVVSNNVQAARMRLGAAKLDGERALRATLDGLTAEGDTRYGIIALQELQRCKRFVSTGHCMYCATSSCHNDHAALVESTLASKGYAGDYHKHGMTNTVGLFYDTEIFDLVNGKMRFADFNRDAVTSGNHKGAVLAVLQHKISGRRVLVVSVHLSVPKDGSRVSTLKPLAEISQLNSKIQDCLQREDPLIPVVMLGDFNSTWQLSVDQSIAPPDVYRSIRSLGYSSAYETVAGREPAYTSIKRGPGSDTSGDFIHCIDFIFYYGLTPAGVWGVVPIARDSLPYPQFPSDHLPVAAIFNF